MNAARLLHNATILRIILDLHAQIKDFQNQVIQEISNFYKS